jgi:hypothetical protein
VAITGQNPATLDAARKELGDGVLVIQSNASGVGPQNTRAQPITAAFGQLDILFVNAGIVEMRPVGQWDEPAVHSSGFNSPSTVGINSETVG